MSQNKPIEFVKKLVRESKAPFPTISTSLWLADIVSREEEKLELSYTRYIYVHRDSVGKITGISISKSLVNEHSNIESQYIAYGDLMFTVLNFYIDDIKMFCDLWADEFEQFFLLKPRVYFAAKWRCNT